MASKAPVAIARILISIAVGIAIGYYTYTYTADNPLIPINDIGSAIIGIITIPIVYLLLTKLGKGSGD